MILKRLLDNDMKKKKNLDDLDALGVDIDLDTELIANLWKGKLFGLLILVGIILIASIAYIIVS